MLFRSICQLSSGDPSAIENMREDAAEKFMFGLARRLEFYGETNPENNALCERLVGKLKKEEVPTVSADKAAKKKKDEEDADVEDEGETLDDVEKALPKTKRGRAKLKPSPYIETEALEVSDSDDSYDDDSDSSGSEDEEDSLDEDDFKLVPTSTKLGNGE